MSANEDGPHSRSARSVSTFDVVNAFRRFPPLLVQWGSSYPVASAWMGQGGVLTDLHGGR